MSINTGNIIDYYDGHLSQKKMKEFEKRLQSEPELQEEYMLYCEMNDSFRADSDLETAMNDPALHDIEPMIEEAVEEYLNTPELFDSSRGYVNPGFQKEKNVPEAFSRTGEIVMEMEDHHMNELAESWVTEWIEKKEKNTSPDDQTEKMIEFISRAMEEDVEEAAISLKTEIQKKKVARRIPIYRYAGYVAAAVLAGTLLLTNLIPSGNPEKLFAEYYQPMKALSPVTRGISTAFTQQYNEAVEQYMEADYLSAASLFTELIKQEPDMDAPRFYHGMTQLELGNFEIAIQEFSWLENRTQDYIKDVQWYLGLAYLKTGNKLKAASYFEILSGSEGYYREPSRKLLRRL